MMLLLASVTGVYAESADGILSVNVMNAIEGYAGGRMDIVLNNTNFQEWASFQFDIKAPAGVTITGGEEGELFNGHELNGQEVDETNHIWRFSAAKTSGGSANFKSTTGTLMTVKFTVANPYTTENGQIELSDISVGTINAVNYDVANFNTPFAIDNTSFTLDENARTAFTAPTGTFNVTVKRKLKANVWNTIVLPFDILLTDIETIFGANAEVAQFDGATFTTEKVGISTRCTGIVMKFTKSLYDDKMWCGAPYLIKVAEDKNQLTVDNKNITLESIPFEVENEGTMYGSYTYRSVPEGSLYISNNQLKYSGGNATIKGMRGYFDLNKKLYNYSNDVSASRNIKFDVDGESTTGILNVEEGTIEKENNYFNLHGQRVATPTKGVYIVNGKKVMFK